MSLIECKFYRAPLVIEYLSNIVAVADVSAVTTLIQMTKSFC